MCHYLTYDNVLFVNVLQNDLALHFLKIIDAKETRNQFQNNVFSMIMPLSHFILL